MSERSELRRDVGELIMTGFKARHVDRELQRFFKTSHIGGVVLFAENLNGPEQAWNLCAQLRRAISPRALIAIDQEGGRVQRLKDPFTRLPSMAAVGQTGSPDIARRIGRILGTELGAVGINLDFAPVLDLGLHADSVIGDRAFHADPERVAMMALALADELAANGVIACGKHFPGHGATARDSHSVLPRAEQSLDELRASHLRPFVAAQAHKPSLPMIMTAHMLATAGDPERPASLSPYWVDEVLRGELGYRGVVITDELGMGAISGERPAYAGGPGSSKSSKSSKSSPHDPTAAPTRATGSIEDTILRLLETSTDIFLIRDIDAAEKAVTTIHRALAAGLTTPERIQSSAQRVRRLKKAYEGRAMVASTPEELSLLIGDPEDRDFAEALRY